MELESLHLNNFRCLSSCDLEFSSGVHSIVGDNMAGKTSLLEAVYILGRGTSFRQASLGRTIHKDETDAILRLRFRDENDGEHRIGCRITRNGHQLKLDDRNVTRRFDLITALPLQHVDPNVHRLIEQGPKYRRHFLDWGVFHVEHAFFPAWRRYRRSLKQRNRALREKKPKHQVAIWDPDLVQQGEIIDACRRRYLEQLKERLPAIASRFLGHEGLSFSYKSGWRGNAGFGQALAAGIEQDVRSGFTQQGPHRADFRVSLGSMDARDWASRGQQKLLTTALLLAQAAILLNQRGVRSILLMDDMAAELGPTFREVLADEVLRLQLQCFLTFLEKSQIPDSLRDTPMFHVEHGRVFRV